MKISRNIYRWRHRVYRLDNLHASMRLTGTRTDLAAGTHAERAQPPGRA